MPRPPRLAARALCCLVAATVPLQGCAWLFQSRQAVLVTCAIPGAVLVVDGKSMALGKLALETGVDHVVQCVAEGYAPKTIKISGQEDIAVNWLVCDILLILAYGIGIPFLIVDFASGSIWDLDPRKLVFNLDRLEEQPEPEPEPAELARVERRDLPRPTPETRPQTPPESPPHTPPPVVVEPPLAERIPTEPPPPPLVTKKPPPRPATEPAPAGNPLAQGTPAGTTPAGPGPDGAIEARPASATEAAPVAPPPVAPPPRARRKVHVLTVGADVHTDPRIQGDPGRAALAARVARLPGATSTSSLLGAQATRRSVLAAVAEHEATLGPDDVLVVVVAAPAYVDPDGTAWLLLADTDPTALEDTALGVDVLTGGLERAEAGATVVAVYATPFGGLAGGTQARSFDAAALGPGIIRVVARDSGGADGIKAGVESILTDLADAGRACDGDGNGDVTPGELAAYLRGRALACEVAPP